jgi:hypothetical protein
VKGIHLQQVDANASEDPSIDLEQLARGAIAIYVLNFGCIIMGVIFVFFVGALFVPSISLAVICLILIAIVGCFFYRGVKSMLRRKPLRVTIFLILVVAMHLVMVRYNALPVVTWLLPIALTLSSMMVLLAAPFKRRRVSRG